MGGTGRLIFRALALGVCLAWIGAFAWLLLDGRYLYFLARGFWCLLAIGGLALAALAAAVAFRGLPAPHGPGGPRAAWLPLVICLVPLAFLVVNPRPMPSSLSLTMRAELDRLWKVQAALGLANLPPPRPGAAQPGPASAPAQATTSPSGSAGEIDIVDVFIEYPKNTGRPVELIGMVNRQANLPAGTFVLFRFVITCCAADARPAAVLVACPAGAAQAPPAADTWVRIRGTVARTALHGLDMPVVNAQEVTPIPAPANPYTY